MVRRNAVGMFGEISGGSALAGLAAVAVCGWVAVAEGRVTRLEILEVQTPTSGAKSFGSAGPYEKIAGKAHGELDPNDPRNAIITDILLAPRNAHGKVEYVATFALVKPIDMSKASGVLMYSVVNRGNGAPTPGPEGQISLVSGWQGDVVPTSSNQTIQVPVAENPGGTSITGPFVTRFTSQSGNTAALIIPRNQPSPYPPASLDTTQASLVSATSETAIGVKSGTIVIPSSDWAFANCATVPFPGTPDPARVCLKNGFDPALLYELKYTVKRPLVLGVGLAATRDLNSFFRYEAKDDFGTPNPVAGKIRWAISEGSSQSGTFLKLSLLLGFNQDESGRIVWDGSNPNIAARVTDLNRRFALPGGLVSPYELGHEAVTWWDDWKDTARGRPVAGILDRCRVTHTCPKIMETFGGTEVWGLRHSFVLIGTTAVADLPLPDDVRRYYFPGTNHGGGPGGFNSTTPAVAGCVLPSNPAPTAPMRSALLAALTDWVVNGTPMPPSKYPRLADGTLVPATRAAMGFPAIAGWPSPDGVLYPLLDYDVGPTFNYNDDSGVPTQLATVKQVLPQLVSRVDVDGNEVAGIKSPLQVAPLGTYTGWNVVSSGVFQGQMCIFNAPVGGYIPFARTVAERLAHDDPRRSLEERYHTHDGYVLEVTKAANTLVKERYLLPADAAAMISQAQASDILR